MEYQYQLARDQQIEEDHVAEVMACMDSFAYFVDNYCWIYDGTSSSYVRFHLWPGQMEAVEAVETKRLLLLLKARQLGMTWLCLAYALWLMVFKNDSTILLFSLRDNEACELVSRLYEMHKRLPDWFRVKCSSSNSHTMTLSNGSTAMAFSTTSGDSYNATLAIVDEADLVPDLDRMMGRVKPTIDAGGKFFLVSRVDKKYPESFFKKQYRAIQGGELPDWHAVFLPWSARPERVADPDWYENQKKFSLSTTGSLDLLYEQYPATPEEALAANSLDKRFPPEWLAKCYVPSKPLPPVRFKIDAPAIPQMRVYVYPDPRRKYVIGADPAQGNPNSDDSALIVLDDLTGEEVCNCVGKFEPAVFGNLIDKIAKWYKAPVMVERNNHGHAVILWLSDHGKCRVLDGPDEDKGFYTTTTTKIKGYDELAEAVRSRKILIHDAATYHQLEIIESATLRAPDTMHDDRAMAFMMAQAARGKGLNFSGLVPLKINPEHSKVMSMKERALV